jgi:sugar/nucleoside kinase (ribokinase family)
MGTPKILCVGNAVMDILGRPVDSLAPAGTSQPLDEVRLSPGGNAINTGIALARLGVPVEIAAAVGNDRLGRLMREAVRAEGIGDSSLVTLEGLATSVSIVLVESGGERRLLHFRGANAGFSLQHLDWRSAEGARIFFYASAFAVPSFDGPPLAEALAHARKLGCITALNVCWDLQGRWLNLLQSSLASTDIFFPNIEEGRQLTGEKSPEGIAAKLRQLGVKTVVVKLGAQGCLVVSEEGSLTSPGFPVKPVDTTGAGDCFAAGFLAEVARGASLADAARFANAAGALCTLGMGAADSAPARHQVEQFLGRHSPPSRCDSVPWS